ncbi:MAG: Abi family protein [Bacteroidales bacterium]|nr:Abi family protein [Bacteroidales bacterium]
MSVYCVRPFSISEQIGKFEREGILLNESDEAEKLLFNVNYFRLRAYAYPFYDNGGDGESLSFRDGISFGDVVDLYAFDQDLRMLLFKAIAAIEVSLRTRITQIYSESTGSGHWFIDRNMYRCNYDILMGDITKDVDRSSEDFISHYKETYSEPVLPPCWMTFEVLSFGTLSRLYQALKKSPEKRKVAHSYGIADLSIFENWMHTISNLRNQCAHHNKTWNRRFRVNMVIPYGTSRPFMDRSSASSVRINKLFPLLCAIKFLMDSIDETNDFKASLIKLLNRPLRLLSLRNMGFPNNWELMPVWQ